MFKTSWRGLVVASGFFAFLWPAAAQAQDAGTVVSEKHSGLCVDVAGRSQANGTQILQWTCSGATHQDFAFQPVGDAYRVVAQHSGKCMGVENGSTQRGARVRQYDCGSAGHLLWTISGTGADREIKAQHTGMCLDISGGSRRRGMRLIQWPCHGGNNQKWRINASLEDVQPPAQPKYGEVVAAQLSGQCLNIFAGSRGAGGRAIQWPCQGEQNARFAFLRVGDAYRILPEHSAKCLGAENGSFSSGAFVRQYDCTDSQSMLWTISGSGADRQIRAVHSGLCLSVQNNARNNGAQIVQGSCNNGPGTRWRIDVELGEEKDQPALWDAPLDLPLVGVAVANLPDGKLLLWSAYSKTTFGGARGFTETVTFDPTTNTVEERLVIETGHDMFCPGTSQLADGRILITGGSNDREATLYNPNNSEWTSAARMNIGRGYHGQTVLSDGAVFTVGGSWSGGVNGKVGELWRSGRGWTLKSGIATPPLETDDARDTYRADNHMWLLQAPNGRVFHAGPSRTMHWIDTSGDGRIQSAGRRGDDDDAMNGNAIMYDVGKILVTGGAPDYDGASPATNNAYIIDINGGIGGVSVESLDGMRYNRTMQNSVVLPSGEVVIVGGQEESRLFTDRASVMNPEIWNPETKAFTELAPMAIPRNYHSVAILMKDGRVAVSGGGLCGFCDTNHPDIEILTPPYLLNADGSPAVRPVMSDAPFYAVYGSSFEIDFDAAGPGASFALVRLSAATHSVNNDQRRIPLQARNLGGGKVELSIPDNPNVVTPGNYFLFGMDANGVPSVGHTIKIRR